MYELTGTIPLPANNKKGRKRGSKYPFVKMGIGDSFFAPNVKLVSMYQTARKAAKDMNRKHIVRQTLENNVLGVRVWRTK
jgi:hypothetical protein